VLISRSADLNLGREPCSPNPTPPMPQFDLGCALRGSKVLNLPTQGPCRPPGRAPAMHPRRLERARGPCAITRNPQCCAILMAGECEPFSPAHNHPLHVPRLLWMVSHPASLCPLLCCRKVYVCSRYPRNHCGSWCQADGAVLGAVAGRPHGTGGAGSPLAPRHRRTSEDFPAGRSTRSSSPTDPDSPPPCGPGECAALQLVSARPLRQLVPGKVLLQRLRVPLACPVCLGILGLGHLEHCWSSPLHAVDELGEQGKTPSQQLSTPRIPGMAAEKSTGRLCAFTSAAQASRHRLWSLAPCPLPLMQLRPPKAALWTAGHSPQRWLCAAWCRCSMASHPLPSGASTMCRWHGPSNARSLWQHITAGVSG
jgi:hypothetical protein